MGKSEALPTIWEIPDDLWEQIHPVILEIDPPAPQNRSMAQGRGLLSSQSRTQFLSFGSGEPR